MNTCNLRFNKRGVVYIPVSMLIAVILSASILTMLNLYGSTLVARVEPDQSVHYYHPDHLGSTTLITDQSGNVVEETFYEPFGAVTSGGSADVKLYTGQFSDGFTGQYYYGARYYLPSIGKFGQPDSIIQQVYNPQNLNRYSYAWNNPYKYKDTSGNYVETAIDVGFILYDLKTIKDNPKNWINYAALTLDVITTALPIVAGGGLIVRGGEKAVRGISKTDDVVKAAEKTAEAVKAADKATDAVDLSKVPEHARRAKEYESFKVLQDGKIRYYTGVKMAGDGSGNGARYVTEVNSKTGEVTRVWQEIVDKKGNVIEVHPKKPADRGHIETGKKSKGEKNGK